MPTATLVILPNNNTLLAHPSAIHQLNPATLPTHPRAVHLHLVSPDTDTLLLPQVRHHQLPMAPPLPMDTPLQAHLHQLLTDTLLQLQELILHHLSTHPP